MTFPLAKTLLPEPQGTTDPRDYADNIQQRLRGAVRTARAQLGVARMQLADRYNKGCTDVEFTVGDVVLRRSHPLSEASMQFAASLAHKWEGPHIISQEVSRLPCLLKNCRTCDDAGPVHIADLKWYYSPD